MRLLAGDVGGTKTLLRCVEPSGATSAEQRYRSGDYETFDLLLRDFMQQVQGPVDGACFAVAGPVIGGTAEVTNVGWNITESELASSFGIAKVALINDFYGIALGVPLLRDEDLLSLHGGTRDRTSPMAVLGAGTGLGQAMVAFHRGEHFVLPTEGGHADFAPQDEEQSRLFVQLQKQLGGHVSWERVLSGAGLTHIYMFLGGAELAPAEIAKLAEQGDERGERTFRMFVDVYGAEAGNMALRVLARGGVFLAGGIAAKNQRWFTDGRFVDAFLRKGRFRDLLDTIPVDLIVNEQVGLIGAVEGARRALESALPLFR
jgi:glucokinase